MHTERLVREPTYRSLSFFFLVASFMTMSACVIPIGPQFDDPEDNFPPFVVSSEPGVGEIFTQDETVRFISVTLGDNNVGDRLYARWLLDYPSTDPDGGKLLLVGDVPPDGDKVARRPIHFAPTCPPSGMGGTAQHRLVLSVSDRRFLDRENGDSVSPNAPRDSFSPGANRMRAVWILNCP
jgi:hypothetical protein